MCKRERVETEKKYGWVGERDGEERERGGEKKERGKGIHIQSYELPGR